MNEGKEFIIDFLEAVVDFAKNADSLFIQESLHYKDLRMQGINPDAVYKGLHNLRRRKIIEDTENGFKLTTNGQKWALNASRRYLRIKIHKWDGKWRIVIFDIPEDFAKSRNALRRRLRLIGFYMLQKSVFVHPADCTKEINEFCDQLNISEYVDVIVSDNIGKKDDGLKKYFELK